ncbi:MAG: transcriptional regulator [Proteobacteria bacterium]|nr:transcriptional regulator [Pseudomonadota bacterium]
MSKSLVEMAAEIITAQATQSRMTPEEISEGLRRTFEALKSIQSHEETGQEVAARRGPRAAPSASIQRNKIICLECAKEFKQLSKNHLASHGLTPKSYKEKHAIPARTPLTAKSLSARRRKMAKERGLGQKLAAARKKKSRK